MLKNQLRKEALLRRKKAFSYLTSAEICKRATELSEFKNAKTIMVYLNSKSEVDTSFLIAEAQRQGKKICTPIVLNDKDMKAAILDGSGLILGAFGIWEPKGNFVDDIDLIFVPGVVFDKERNRIGYGKGYYDRFLQHTKATTIGLAFSCQIVPYILAEQHDKRLDMIITEEGIIE